MQVKDETTGEIVKIYDKQAKGYTEVLRNPANHIYYPDGAHMPATVTLDLRFETALDATHTYTLYVRGYDDFGVGSNICTYTIALP